MRILQNILYVLTPGLFLRLDGENIVLLKENEEQKRVPLHNLEGIIVFGHMAVSSALLGACVQRQIAVTFLTTNGRFLARVVGENTGNVLLRRTQYRTADDLQASAAIGASFVLGKLFNCRWVVERAGRDHALRLDTEKLKRVSSSLMESMASLRLAQTLEEVRGIEGEAAVRYFSVFDDLILQQKEEFVFHGRSRRPPMDKVNALLSFVYTLLAHDASAALSSAGLDPYVGFLHRDRPGRTSLALDLMEELRSVMADRFVLTLINNRQVNGEDFQEQEDGAVQMGDDARKTVLAAWQKRKQETITHPFLKEKMEWGLVPYAQAMLLARYLRGDLDAYPPFMWK